LALGGSYYQVDGLFSISTKGTTSYSGDIGGPGTVRFNGPGTLALDGNLSLSGALLVPAGHLVFNGSVGAPTTIVELTTSNGRMTLGGAAGTIALAITATDTTTLAAGQYVYDMEMVSSGGEVTRLLEGRATISAEVTR
jgi:hypothetical protein